MCPQQNGNTFLKMMKFIKIVAIAVMSLFALTSADLCFAAGAKKAKTKTIIEERPVKPISYNKLLKSHLYDTMYVRALQYFNFRKPNRKGEMINTYSNYVKCSDLLERATPHFGGSEKEDSVADVGKRFTLSASGGKKQVINRIYGVTAIPPPQESAFAIRRANIC